MPRTSGVVPDQAVPSYLCFLASFWLDEAPYLGDMCMIGVAVFLMMGGHLDHSEKAMISRQGDGGIVHLGPMFTYSFTVSGRVPRLHREGV